MRFPTLAPGHALGYHVVFPVSSPSTMTRVEPQRETKSSRERRLPPFAAGRRPRRSAGFPRDEHRLFFFLYRHGEGRGKRGGGCTEVRGHRLRVRSFPGVKALLELGAGVAEVEALLADCVVAVKADEQDASRRVDRLPGLRTERRTREVFFVS